MTEQANQDNGTLVLALISGLSISGTFAAFFSPVVTFSIFPIITLVLTVYCLHLRYHQGEMSKGLPTLVALCFLLGMLLHSTIIRAEYPQIGSNFLPSVICVVLLFWIGAKLKKRKSEHV
ncbi:YijD family membrane protein [Hafnia psychrotolerans]|jgi:FtsH-binding integral membrane protein|uniref:Membrane protein n=1 Tax=Hafnia psychrotolerans TaxID=1477018 RepID=A0ABQ1H4Y0_9GAMM|nr:YijD family membrane protein [Hafnia psychrotolerans]GGA57592.1 membrane protein [Hafnia psychrotolerans]